MNKTLIAAVLLIATIVVCFQACGAKSEPEAEAEPRSALQANYDALKSSYDALYSDYMELQIKYEYNQVQYEAYRDSVRGRQDQSQKFKEALEALNENHEALQIKHSELRDALQLVKARKDSTINEGWPSDNKTAKAEKATFYEVWDEWWEVFEEKL